MRWDRVGRLALLGVLVALVYLYVSAGISLWGAWRTSHQDRATVAALERQHTKLKSQRRELKTTAVLEAEARRLGMALPTEKSFVVHGLPPN